MLLGAIPGVTRAGTLLVPEDYTFEAALVAAAYGDTVSVAPHTLDGGVVSLGNGMTLVSRESGANRLGGLTVENLDHVRVEGFLVGEASYPGGISEGSVAILSSVVTFTECTFQYIISWDGPPILHSGPCEILFERCTFRENTWRRVTEGVAAGSDCIVAGWGAEGSLTIRDCVFKYQSAPIAARVPLRIEDTQFIDCGPFLIDSHVSLEMSGCLVAGFGVFKNADYLAWECYDVTGCIEASGSVEIEGNTFVDTIFFEAPVVTPCYGHEFPPEQIPATIVVGSLGSGVIENNLFVGLPSSAVDAPATVTVSCNDVWGIAGPPWRGGIGDVTGIDGNINEAPLFCGRWAGDYTLSSYSPATAEHSGCGRMGAYGVACETTPVLLQSFDAQRKDRGVELRWFLSESREVVIQRISAQSTMEIHRALGADGVFMDEHAPAGRLRYRLGVVREGEEIDPLGEVVVEARNTPSQPAILGAFPNPFNPSTTIRFTLGSAEASRLDIHDAAGRLVQSFSLESLPAGKGSITWDGRDSAGKPVASGMYIVRLVTRSGYVSKAITLLK